MYLDFYGLTDPPFELTPDPKFMFMAPPHREAISNVQYGIEGRKGLTVLIGDAGLGKTTVLRTALRGLQRNGAVFCHVSNPTLTREEFLELLGISFGLRTDPNASKTTVLQALEMRLQAWQGSDRLVALVVDEAQSLSDELLEEIRLLSNMETDNRKLLPLVLAGQPELGDRLNAPNLRQIKQRIALRCQLRPLTLQETAAYIVGRIRKAGGDTARVFTRDAVKAIHECSSGIPRVISVVCDNAMVSGMALDRRPVTRELIIEVARDFDLIAPAVDLLHRAPAADSLAVLAAETPNVPPAETPRGLAPLAAVPEPIAVSANAGFLGAAGAAPRRRFFGLLS